ncbi:ECF-type sigma factor [Luteibacter sp. PPL201]|jgi:RNA polymerase sigma factor (TIGR02999 family)|uniref:ECF-type sigma factor n=1 Tax=Luteibacter sahnii TaxID=3021977 RepID=A0ABT6BBZ5_9GAMM|nr:ECF-type sigma factor [Luteibacter sp. PPL193]MDY1547619.1 ECF-type sigma factor [Luteibacter sp. PPL193]
MADVAVPGDGPADEFNRLMRRAEAGEPEAMDELMRRMYGSLRRMARAQLRQEHGDCTLAPTELVNEAYLRLFAGGKAPATEDQAHLAGLASRAMRRVLIDAARRRDAQKRPPASERTGLTHWGEVLAEQASADQLDDALRELEALDPRQARIVEMRFFVGLREEEIGAILGVSARTVQREWRIAREWLRRALTHA